MLFFSVAYFLSLFLWLSYTFFRGCALRFSFFFHVFIIIIIIIVISLHSQVKFDVFLGKKCRNSAPNQLLYVLQLFFFHFISNTFDIILAVPIKQVICNTSIVKSNSNFSISQSALSLILMPPLLPV